MLIVVTGGSGSGKSEYAENQVLELSKDETSQRFYIATMFPFDEESHRRIERHHQMRAKKNFETIEAYVDIKSIEFQSRGVVLLECMSNLVANEMYREDGAKEKTVETILDGIKEIEGKCEHLVVVTNEVFSDGIAYDEDTMRYLKYLGEINQELGRKAQKVVEVVYGISIVHKNER